MVFDERGIEVVGLRVDIHEYRHGTHLQRRAGRRHKRIRRHDDFIANLNSGGTHGHLQRGRAAAHAEAVSTVMELRELLFKLRRARAAAPPVPTRAAQHVRHRVYRCIVYQRPTAEGRLAQFFAATNR